MHVLMHDSDYPKQVLGPMGLQDQWLLHLFLCACIYLLIALWCGKHQGSNGNLC